MRALKHARGLGLTTALFTGGIVDANGGVQPASREVFGALAGDLNRVVFTLHSAQADQHDAITRVPGSHGGAIEAIQRSVDAGIPTEFHFVPMEQPASELRLLFELAANLGVQTIRVIRFVPHGRGRRETALRPTATALRELKPALDELRRDGRVTLRVGPAFRFLVDYAPFCTAGIEELVVSSNGDVYPCSGFLGYDGPEAVGNVSASTLEDVWTSAPFVCATRNLINDRLANRAMHRVGCPAQKAFVAGRITDDIPDPDLLGRVG
jgi:MoaA/NifB/PqqE/SkfB family radical SAM enzyme